MDAQGRVPRNLDCVVHALRRLHHPVLGVLEAQQSGTGEMAVVGFDGSGDCGGIGQAVALRAYRLRRDPTEHRTTPSLQAECVGSVAGDELVAAAAMGQQGAQIGLGSAGDEQRSLLVEPFSHHGLESVDRGVVAEDVVAHLGLRHCPPHRIGGPGHRV